MIRSLVLHHFQSHKSSELHFHPGVNAIIGTSNSGKSAIIRGLLWALENRPSGIEFVSLWNRDKKGDPKETTSVLVGLDSVAIARARGKGFNGYEIYTAESEENGAPAKILEAVGTDVPEEIVQAFNLSSVNIQRQMDAPFLLSDNAADVARFFNSIIRLDIIDRVLGAAEGKRRKIIAEGKEVEAASLQLQKQLKALNWIESAQEILGRLERVQTRIEERQASIETLEGLLQSYAESQCDIQTQDKILEAQSLLNQVSKAYGDCSVKTAEINQLSELIRQFNTEQLTIHIVSVRLPGEPIIKQLSQMIGSLKSLRESVQTLRSSIDDYYCQRNIAEADWMGSANKLIGQALQKENAIKVLRGRVESLEDSLAEYERLQGTIHEAEENITVLSESLPDTCPTCGAPIDKEGKYASHNHR